MTDVPAVFSTCRNSSGGVLDGGVSASRRCPRTAWMVLSARSNAGMLAGRSQNPLRNRCNSLRSG